ncbi:hypothetical protein HPB49_007138 [Dermacentor silvarum]|uniref:Uncharacterized protein n=1 Tax=Dermacentor silvarum TaxID=543639 RepID=A0ACB8CJP0_DERSI|nr:hypothetical protein HPB49_007138 [Dermacentor silvarum]
MSQKPEKPTLSGQRIKTRKRDEKEKYDPSGFRDAILQGFAEAGSDLDAVHKFLDAAGSKLDYRRYGEVIFDILLAGGILDTFSVPYLRAAPMERWRPAAILATVALRLRVALGERAPSASGQRSAAAISVRPVDLDDFTIDDMLKRLRNVRFEKMNVANLAGFAELFVRAGNSSFPFAEKLRIRWRCKKVTRF